LFLQCVLGTSTALSLSVPASATSVTATAPFADCTLYVGNLDWSLPMPECKALLTNVVGGEAVIDIKKKTTRKRDEGKCHGGSATLTFTSHQQATQALELLETFAKENERNHNVRFAFVAPEPEPIVSKDLTVNKERIELRKARAKSYSRQRRRVADRTDRIIQSLRADLPITVPVLNAPQLDWSFCPNCVDPMGGGGLTSERGSRKRAAVEAFLFVLVDALLDQKPPTHIQVVADLGCGAGNLSLPLAWWLQSAGVLVRGVDINAISLNRLAQRASDASVDLEQLEMDLVMLIDTSDATASVLSDCSAVVSLHACGAASDMSIAAAVANSLPFAVSPCCIGKVKRSIIPGGMPSLESGTRSGSRRTEISFPRSVWLCQTVTPNEYELLAAAADYGGSNSVLDSNEFDRRQRCREAKQIVELDRLQWAQEHGYYVRMLELPRIGPLYSKRELLLGAKEGSEAASRIKSLPVSDMDTFKQGSKTKEPSR
jgi:SAM-dependent methyltransferase